MPGLVPGLEEHVYVHAPAWQVGLALALTAILLAALAWRAVRADTDAALSLLSPELRHQPAFGFDHRTGLRALNRPGRALLGQPDVTGVVVSALTSALETGHLVQRPDCPAPGRTLVAIAFGEPARPARAALGFVVDQTLVATAAGHTSAEPWIILGPAVRLHAARPVVLVRRSGDDWDEAALTPVEESLLRHLHRHRGEIRTAEELFAVAWPDDPVDRLGLRPEQGDRLRRLVFQLRQRLEPDPTQPRHLRTARGVGYALYGDEGAA